MQHFIHHFSLTYSRFVFDTAPENAPADAPKAAEKQKGKYEKFGNDERKLYNDIEGVATDLAAQYALPIDLNIADYAKGTLFRPEDRVLHLQTYLAGLFALQHVLETMPTGKGSALNILGRMRMVPTISTLASLAPAKYFISSFPYYRYSLDLELSEPDMKTYLDVMAKKFLESSECKEDTDMEKNERSRAKGFANAREAYQSGVLVYSNSFLKPKEGYEYVDPKSEYNFGTEKVSESVADGGGK